MVALAFALIRLVPGDPFASSLDQQDVPIETRERMRAVYGFDAPIPVQFVRFVGALARGELGWSFSRNEPVSATLAASLPPTLLLMGAALFVGGLAGVAVGAWQGWRGDTLPVRLVTGLSLTVLSVPEFVLALLLVMGPALAWGLFPVSGMRDDLAPGGLAGLLDLLHHLVLPAAALACIVAAIVARHQRRAMRAVMGAEFVRAARANGVPERRIAVRHALRNALVPVLALGGVLFPSLVSGAVLVERIFAWPGMGRTMVDAVMRRDYPLVSGALLVSSVFVVLGTVLADLAVAWADPRRRDR